MGKLHKDTALFMVQCVEKQDITDEQLIKVSYEVFALDYIRGHC